MTIAIFGSANIDIAVNVDELPDSGQTIHARGQQINIGVKKVHHFNSYKRGYVPIKYGHIRLFLI